MALYSSNVFVMKRSYFGRQNWIHNQLQLNRDLTLVWIKNDRMKARCKLIDTYKRIGLKVITADNQYDPKYGLVIPMKQRNAVDCKDITFTFESIHELCKWLRLFVSVLGGRDWISQLIPVSDTKWKIDSAIGYVCPYDSNWPETLEKWPWLWYMFRSCKLALITGDQCIDVPLVDHPINNFRFQCEYTQAYI